MRQITSEGALVSASNARGIAWGTSTLLQLVEPGEGVGGSLPAVEIADAPKSPYRAVMIDVARQPHSIAVLEDVVRLARLYKVRYVQLHLTDDQLFTFPFEPVVSKLENNHSYTRAELVGLVRYAEARGVTLIPEIDLPGHSSRLRQSGYLPGVTSDRELAQAQHTERIAALLNEVMDVFEPSPYVHLGGDESGAGAELVPFLGRMNRVVRARGKRMIVWEGFHGAPIETIPATGEDRVLVAAWESSYNAPWDLLAAGYELINASWRPLYIVGGHSTLHPGSSAGRKWDPAEMATWSKDRFMHWEPGRPVFEDRGPGDSNLEDATWDVPTADWRRRVLGGQISVWEQRESSVIDDLRRRLPVLAERLWSGADATVHDVLRRVEAADARVFGLVQPVGLSVEGAIEGPAGDVACFVQGEQTDVRVTARTRYPGEVVVTRRSLGASPTWIPQLDHPWDPTADDAADASSFTLRARLVDEAGVARSAGTWLRVIDWPARVQVTDYDVGLRGDVVRRAAEERGWIDLGALPEAAVTSRHAMPTLRGPLRHARIKGQRLEANLVAPRGGPQEIGMKTQSGRATLWLDLDRDGLFEEDERLIDHSPTTEALVRRTVELEEGASYALRIDHLTALPRPVLIVTLDEVGAERPREVTEHLARL